MSQPRLLPPTTIPRQVLAVGVTPELLREPGARLQLHAFSARNARAELAQKAGVLAARAGGGGGGLMMSCLGRGEALSGGWLQVPSTPL